ncbi:MAG: hypothetical protein ABIH65_00325 [Nanoarchaeota archaeon]
MAENLENRTKKSKPYYKLQSKDFIPVYGIVNYCSRVYEESNFKEHAKEKKIREATLYLYNGMLISGTMISIALS